uniref:Uncharacterized protein n=1 Tax=Ditylenchus dipsaci TaxID=166011 RepID=A0A915EIB4_9BILA
MPFFDYDGGNSNPASGHSSDQLHSCSSLRSSFQYSHSITAEEDQESYEPAEKRHFQKQQSPHFLRVNTTTFSG